MAQRPRRSAGADVSASAEQLSDSTLDAEEEAFVEIDAAYSTAAEVVAELISTARDLSSRSPVWPAVHAAIVAAAISSTTAVARLLSTSTSSAARTLAEQLAVIEATLPARFAGTAQAALGAVASEDAAESAREAFAAVVDDVVASTVDAIDEEVARWRVDRGPDRRTAPDPERLVDRLTSDRSPRGVVRRPASSVRSAARAQSIGATNDLMSAGIGSFNTEATRRGLEGDPIRKQVLAHIDSGTTVVCLHAAGQIRDVDEPFDTLAGEFARPPFHWGCRSLVIPWARGMVQPHRDAANDELKRRPEAERRIGPGGEVGGRIPGSPEDRDPLGVDELPDDFVDDPDLDLDDVPNELRLPYMRAHPERFSIYATAPGSWWVTDSAGTRWNLRK